MRQSHVKTITALGVLLLCGAHGQAQITLPDVFSDNMVLQQKSEVPVWGWGNASETITIVGSWAPQDTVKTVVNSNGKWEIAVKTGQEDHTTCKSWGATNSLSTTSCWAKCGFAAANRIWNGNPGKG